MHVLDYAYQLVVDWEPADIKLAHVLQVDMPRSLAHVLKKWQTICLAVQRGDAGSLQRSGFRKKPTNFLTFVAEYVTAFAGQADAQEVKQTDRQTDRQRDPTTVTPTVHARRGLMKCNHIHCI